MGAAQGSRIRAMDATPKARATLEMELTGKAPAGTLTSADGVSRQFTGWSELATAIEEWRTLAAGKLAPSGRGEPAGGVGSF
jgi:hypothetical protein